VTQAERPRIRTSGRLSIDLALTGGEGPELARFEVLHAPADLDAWLLQCALRVPGTAATEADVRDARRLRWAIWHAVQAAAAGRAPAEHDAAVIEEVAARAPLAPRLDGTWAAPSAAAALADCARDAVAVLADPAQRARLRICAAPDCPVPFFDDSRPGRRRWCEPGRCGDRHRQRTRRSRRREHDDQEDGT
jgi:predicted RNA-binding Zn ribbon-like protein